MSKHRICVTLATASAVAATLFAASPSPAREYVDYGFGKGIWQVSQIEVDPNHVDDYLTGLKKSQIPSFEILKKHGLIDEYIFAVRNGYTKGIANVVIQVHFVSAAGLMPDQARDQMLEKEMIATLSEADSKIAVAGYEKYRQFVDTATWIDVVFRK